MEVHLRSLRLMVVFLAVHVPFFGAHTINVQLCEADIHRYHSTIRQSLRVELLWHSHEPVAEIRGRKRLAKKFPFRKSNDDRHATGSSFEAVGHYRNPEPEITSAKLERSHQDPTFSGNLPGALARFLFPGGTGC